MEDHSTKVPLKREDSMGLVPMDPTNASTPVLVGIAGGSASGKTTLCNRIISELGDRNCLVVSLDSFYLGVAPEKAKGYDFDHPNALDWDLCFSVVQKLLNNEEAEIPIYNFATHSREKQWVKLKPCSLILFEGILALHDPRIVKLMNFRIFVACDDDVRLYRRLVRDVKERERDVGGVLYQYNRFVKPAYADFIKPSSKWANIIVPGNSDNSVAVNFVVENLRSHLYKVEELKSNANKNFDFMGLLDTIWLNTVADQESELSALFKYNRVLLPIDEYVRNECLNLFNLLSSKFSKTLYTICMSRFLTYGVKMLTKLKPKDPKKYVMIHHSSDLAEYNESIKEAEIAGIIVPIWDQEATKQIREKIESLHSVNNSLEIFVFSVFADIETMTELTQWKSNIFVICNLCLADISNIEPLYGMLKENCTEDYNFNQQASLIDTLQETCERVFKRHSEVLTRVETTHATNQEELRHLE